MFEGCKEGRACSSVGVVGDTCVSGGSGQLLEQ